MAEPIELDASMRLAQRTDPQSVATALNSGLPVDVALRNPGVRVPPAMPAADQIVRDAPRLADFMADPINAAVARDDILRMSAIEQNIQSDEPSLIGNAAKLTLNRLYSLGGTGIQVAAELAGAFSSVPYESFGPDGMVAPDPEVPNPVVDAMRAVGISVEQESQIPVDQLFPMQRIMDDPSPSNIAGLILEKGPSSVVDMLAAVYALPAYMATLSHEIASNRNEADGEANTADLAETAAQLPVAVVIALMDRLGAKGSLGMLTEQAGITTGRQVAGEVAAAAAREGVTEFTQETLQYTAESVGTAQGYQPIQAWERALEGMLVGTGMGGAVRSVTAPYQAAVNRRMRTMIADLTARQEQAALDTTLAELEQVGLRQMSPPKFSEYIRTVSEGKSLFLDPDVLDTDVSNIPFLQGVTRGEQDIEISYEDIASVLDDKPAMAALRPYLKTNAASMSQAQMEATRAEQDSITQRMIRTATEDRALVNQSRVIFNDVSQQLIATGRMSPEVAGVGAELYPAYIATKVQALRQAGVQVEPRDLYEMMGFRAEAMVAPTAGGLEQVAPPATSAFGFTRTDAGWVNEDEELVDSELVETAIDEQLGEMRTDPIPRIAAEILPELLYAQQQGIPVDELVLQKIKTAAASYRPTRAASPQGRQATSANVMELAYQRDSLARLRAGEGPLDDVSRRRAIAAAEATIAELERGTFQQQPMPATIDIDGVQRPTTNSNGQPIAQTEEAIRAFYAWFGDSKVVDDQGRPLVVYHGTLGEFEAFGTPSFFTANPSEASAYTLSSRLQKMDTYVTRRKALTAAPELVGAEVPYVGIISDIYGMPDYSGQGDQVWATDQGVVLLRDGKLAGMYTNLEVDYEAETQDYQTAILRAGEGASYAEWLEDARTVAAEDAFAKAGGRVLPVYLSLQNPISLGPFEANALGARLGATDPEVSARVADWKAQGYDGIFTSSDEAALIPELAEGQRTDQYVAFDPTQIKSAIGNSGTFDPNDPSILRQDAPPGSVKATPGVDMVRMARLLGPQLYGNMSDIGIVTIKEVFQNSFDALKGAIQKGDKTSGRIDIEVDSYARTITITDDGTGMTPDIINKAFLTLAGTSKETDRASGGLGIAKMLFLFGNESLSLRTVRDGVESTLSTSGTELMASFSDPSVAPNIQTRATDDPPGTTVTIKIPETYTDENGEVQSIDFPYKYRAEALLEESPLLENIEVRLNGDTLPIGANFPADDYTVLANAKFAWGNMRVLVRPREASEYGRNVQVLSNGLFQFDDTLKKNPLDFWGPVAPFKFYFNIEPNVPADSPLYPIALNRKGFSMSAKADFDALMKYLSVLYANKDDAESAQSFGDLEQVSADGKTSTRISLVVPEAEQGSTLAINPGDKVEVRDGRMYVNNREMPEITKETMAALVRDPGKFKVDPALIDPNLVLIHDNLMLNDLPFSSYMRDTVGSKFDDFTFEVADVFKTLRDATAKVGGSKYADVSSVPVGVSFDLEYYGVNIMVPFRAMMINPAFIRGDDPAKAAQTVVGTLIHELAHHAERNHSETGFIPELQRLFMELALSGDAQAATQQLQKVFNSYPEVTRELRRIQDNERNNLKPKGVRLKGDADATDTGSVADGQDSGRGAGDAAGGSASSSTRGNDSNLPGVRRAVDGSGADRSDGAERARSPSENGGYDPGLALRSIQQTDGTSPLGETVVTDNELIVRLSAASDMSTFLHETAHVFLEMERRIVRKYGVQPNQQAVLDMLGVASYDDITTKEHELFARTFETYLMTGKAPSLRLRDAFAQFAQWLANVYTGLKRAWLEGQAIKLDPATVEVFDRLLATEAEMQQMAVMEEYQPLFTERPADMTEAEWKKYQETLAARRARAQMSVFDKLMEVVRKQRTEEWRTERDDMQQQEAERMAQEPVYQLMDALRTYKLDADAVKQVLGVKKLTGRLKSLSARNGVVDVQQAVESYGFDSARQMLEQLQNAAPLTEAAREAADARMLGKYGDVLNDGTLEQEALAAYHNDVQAQLLMQEIKQLGKRQPRASDINLDILKAKARDTIRKMAVGKLRPAKYRQGEVRAAKTAASATDPAVAREAKIKQLYNHYLWKEATDAQVRYAKARSYKEGVARREYSAARVNPVFSAALRVLAKMYDSRRDPQRKARFDKLTAWFESQDFSVVEVKDLQLARVLAERQVQREAGEPVTATYTPPRFDQLTVEEVDAYVQQMRHLRFIGGKLADEAMLQVAVERQRMLTQIEASKPGQRPQHAGSDRNIEIWESAKKIWFLLPSLRNLTRRLDGFNEHGTFYDLVWSKIEAAHSEKLRLSKMVYDRYKELVGSINALSLVLDSRTMPKQDGTTWTLNAEGRVMLALYWGHDYAREAIRRGHGVTDADVETMLATLTDAQVELVNAIWKINDEVWPMLAEAGRRRDGTAPARTEAMPFEINGKKFTGGHQRLFYKRAQAVPNLMPGDDNFFQQGMSPDRAGSLYALVGSGGRMVELDKNNIFRALDDNLHYIAFADVGMYMQQTIGSKDVQKALRAKYGNGFVDALSESVAGITTNRAAREQHGFIARAMRYFRQVRTFQVLAYSLRNIVQQLSSLPIVGGDLGAGTYSMAVVEFYANWSENKAAVESLSQYMANRGALVNREAAEFLRPIVTGNNAWEMFKKHGFTGQTVVDMAIAYPAWMAKYKQGLEQHGDTAKAVRDADTLVAESVGSGADVHLGALYRSNQPQWVRVMTMFGTWFNTYFNRMYRASKGGTDWMTVDVLEAMVLNPVMVAVLSATLVLDGPEEDEPEDVAEWVSKKYGEFMFGTVPLGSDIVSATKGFSPSGPLAAVTDLPADAIAAGKRVMEGRTTALGATADVLQIGSSVAPLPGAGQAVRVIDYLDSYERGYEPSEGLWPIAEAAVRGPTR